MSTQPAAFVGAGGGVGSGAADLGAGAAAGETVLLELHGLSIGQPCTNCQVPVGSASNSLKTSGMAITSMILGICSIPVCMCYGIPSIILGVIGLVFASLAGKDIRSGGFSDSSKGMTTAGKICSWVGIGLGVAYILFIVVIIIIAESNP